MLRWGVGVVRSLLTLALIGLFLRRLFPTFVGAPTEVLRSRRWPSLGWGVVAYAGFFFLLLLSAFGIILGAIVFGLLTLGGLSGTIIWVGILALLTLILSFVLATSFVTKVVFGATLGKWMLSRLNSPLAEHRYWPMAIGLAVTVVVVALLSFPVIPSFLGGLLNFAVVLFGLGALWLWGRQILARRAAAAA